MAISQELRAEAFDGALRYLDHKGYEVLEVNEDASPNIVAVDEGTIVMIDVHVSIDSFPEEADTKEARVHFETILPRFAVKYDSERPYRYDQICLWVAGENRAMMKHHINIVGNDTMSNLEWLARFNPEALLSMIVDQDRVEWLKAPYDSEDEATFAA